MLFTLKNLTANLIAIFAYNCLQLTSRCNVVKGELLRDRRMWCMLRIIRPNREQLR